MFPSIYRGILLQKKNFFGDNLCPGLLSRDQGQTHTGSPQRGSLKPERITSLGAGNSAEPHSSAPETSGQWTGLPTGKVSLFSNL